MKKYKCVDCGEQRDGESLWACADDQLRCGPCIDAMLALLPEEAHDALYGRHPDGPTGNGYN